MIFQGRAFVDINTMKRISIENKLSDAHVFSQQETMIDGIELGMLNVRRVWNVT
jgi:hypothetical protein